MARARRGVVGKCPNFTAVSGQPGRQQCLVTHGSRRFRIERYKNGNLAAWLVPVKGPITKRTQLPISHRTTRSLVRLLNDAHAFLDRVHGKRN